VEDTSQCQAARKGRRPNEEIDRLREELAESRQLVETLRLEVHQKENIAKLAVDSSSLQPKSQEDFESMYKKLSSEHARLASSARNWESRVADMEVELKDARDTADLLEFRLLELEQRESRERTPELGRRGTERTPDADTASICSLAQDSGCSSQTTLEDILEAQKDFRSEKVSDTKLKLHELMNHIPEPGGKSLLLQTVALFETLLFKIQSLKVENETLVAERAELGKSVELTAAAEARVLLLESELVKANEEIEETKQKARTVDRQLAEARLEADKKEAVNTQVLERQGKVEADLRRDLEQLTARLETNRRGHEAEGQMYQEVLERFSHQERRLKEQEAIFEELTADLFSGDARALLTSGATAHGAGGDY